MTNALTHTCATWSPSSVNAARGWRLLLDRAGFGPCASIISVSYDERLVSGEHANPWEFVVPSGMLNNPADVEPAHASGSQVIAPRVSVDAIDGMQTWAPISSATVGAHAVFRRSPDGRRIGCLIDLPNWCQWLADRVEEQDPARPLDAHDRYDMNASVLARHDVLNVPVIDAWAAALRAAIDSIGWPLPRVDLVPPAPSGSPGWACVSTHDVDHIDRVARRPATCLEPTWRSRIADRLGRGLSAGQRALRAWSTFEAELDWPGTYFFLGQREGTRNRPYQADDITIQAEIAKLLDLGHEVGLHGSYDAMLESDLLEAERDQVVEWSGVELTGIRMHYLRYRHPETARGIAAAGFRYDSSLGYTPAIGFRAGTSVPYISRETSTPLTSMPFSMMDCSFLSSLKMSFDEAASAMEAQMEMLRGLGGVGVLLFHPCRLTTDGDAYDALFRHGLNSAVRLGAVPLRGDELASRSAERSGLEFSCVQTPSSSDTTFRIARGSHGGRLSISAPAGMTLEVGGNELRIRRSGTS